MKAFPLPPPFLQAQQLVLATKVISVICNALVAIQLLSGYSAYSRPPGGTMQRLALPSNMSAPAGFYALPLPIAQLSLDAVLRCGQSFRWFAYPLFSAADTPSLTEPSHEYRFALHDRVVCLRQSHTHLFYRSIYPDHTKDASQDLDDTSTLTWIHEYFQLDVDLVKLYSEWSSRDGVFRRTVNARFTGIRILRQDPWENVASWVLTTSTHHLIFLLLPGLFAPRTITSLVSRRWSCLFAQSSLHLWLPVLYPPHLKRSPHKLHTTPSHLRTNWPIRMSYLDCAHSGSGTGQSIYRRLLSCCAKHTKIHWHF
jgi:hypothetical protein